MGDHSEIQWTDATWNPTTGCTRVSAGCDHCYAFTLHDQRHAAVLNGADLPPQYAKPFSEVQLLPKRLSQPMRWTKPRKIFVDSMSDLFHADVPTDYLVKVFAAMAAAPQHQFQILTKRPQRMHRFITDMAGNLDKIRIEMDELAFDLMRDLNAEIPVWPLPNVWLGTSVENQEAAYRIDWLAKTPAAVRFLSCEPLLGPLDLGRWMGVCECAESCGWRGAPPVLERCHACEAQSEQMSEFCACGAADFGYVCPGCGGEAVTDHPDTPKLLDWVIVGGESGPDYRPLDLDWARDLRDQCNDAGVPYFFKQIGGRTSKAGGRELDGRVWDEMPQVLQAA